MHCKIVLFIIILLQSLPIHCQHEFSGVILDGEHSMQPIEGVEILLTANDTLAGIAITNKKGAFSIQKLLTGNYVLHITHLGYSPIRNEYNIKENTKVELMLHREIIASLDTIVITANENDIIKRTANGMIFHLSERAKNSGNPYKALQEIPQLISDEASASVKMEDGSTPLILIDGNKINTGISPINPKEIESVEIMNVVSARYLKEGVRHILNIKLKKKTKPFLFFETMSRHNLPLNRGMGALYFEIGNQKYSLYSRVAGEYLYRDATVSENIQQNNGYYKQTHETGEANKKNALGELLFKWKVTNKDYLAIHGYGKAVFSKQRTKGNGLLQTEAKQPFNFNTFNRDDSHILTGSLYHKHSFTEKKILETTFAFNKNQNENEGERNETYPKWAYSNLYLFKNSRTSGSMSVDYSYERNKFSINIGSETHFLNDHIQQINNGYPIFQHKEWSEYLYAASTYQIKKFQFLISGGIEGIWLKASNVSNKYFKPRVAISGTYSLENNSVQAGYVLTNTTPSVAMLNPYNTSTDSLIVNQGNPYLQPEQNHLFNISYTFNKKGFYFNPILTYQISTDLIEPYGYSERGIYTSSYRNNAHYKELTIGVSTSYRTKWGRFFGQIGHTENYYPNQTAKKSFYYSLGVMAYYKRFSFYSNYSYNNYSYTAVSRIKFLSPNYSNLQVTYNLTKNLYISACLEYLTGSLHTRTHTFSGSYQSSNSVKQKDKNLRPWILIRYTLHKNRDKKIKLGNILNSKEQGISLDK